MHTWFYRILVILALTAYLTACGGADSSYQTGNDEKEDMIMQTPDICPYYEDESLQRELSLVTGIDNEVAKDILLQCWSNGVPSISSIDSYVKSAGRVFITYSSGLDGELLLSPFDMPARLEWAARSALVFFGSITNDTIEQREIPDGWNTRASTEHDVPQEIIRQIMEYCSMDSDNAKNLINLCIENGLPVPNEVLSYNISTGILTIVLENDERGGILLDKTNDIPIAAWQNGEDYYRGYTDIID